MTDTTIDDAVSLINHLAPGAAAVPIRTPLAQDECRWFVRAVAEES
ncbi:MAG TPA: hypothetical protein VGR26_09815 [Acidimicrobiales bacterium]|nr:hypothetical protein [Acidimicrobiales bacterium]